MSLPKCIIVDLDGTLCDHSHRLGFVDRKYNKTHWKDFKEWMLSDKNEDDPKNPMPKFKPDYESFYEEMGKDLVNTWCRKIIDHMKYESSEDYGVECIFITGRPERYRKITQDWLDKNIPGYHPHLFMRPNYLPKCSDHNCSNGNDDVIDCFCINCSGTIGGRRKDYRPSHEVKREIYEREIRGKYDVLFALDDDPRCVEMYRSLGLTCLDVGRK